MGETIPEGPFCYEGQQPREIITVDPIASPLLNEGYQKLLGQIGAEDSEEEILRKVGHFVCNTLFSLDLCTEENTKQLIESVAPLAKEPEISIETFIDAQTGVCRHLALASTYLTNRLIDEGLLKGTCFLIRDQTHGGRHAWTLYLSGTGAWHLYPLWGFLENGKTEEGFIHLCQRYGKRTMERQKKRWIM